MLQNSHQPVLWLWITHPSHPAELLPLQPHPGPSALHVFHGMFPSLSSWRRLERPCSFPGAVAVFPLFTLKALLGRLGKSCHLGGYCVVDWGGEGKGFPEGFLNLFSSLCTQNKLQQTLRGQSSLNLLNQALVLSISKLLVFLPPFFLVVSCSPEGRRCDFKLCGSLSPGNTASKKGERGHPSLLLAPGIGSAQEGVALLLLCSLH